MIARIRTQPTQGPDVSDAAADWQAIARRAGEVIVGQEELIESLLLGLLADGHVLLEGLPGLAKTLSVQCVAALIDADFKRIQFTPDLLPSDVVGTLIYRPHDGSFVTRHGPVFANLVLADEVNRAPAKVQSALLEAMQERQVTLGGESHPLPAPFLVLATQNPLDQEGTYPLPEAQLDRFLFKVVVRYPQRTEEREILERASAFARRSADSLEPRLHARDVLAARELVRRVHVDARVKDYIVSIVLATRAPAEAGLDELSELIEVGASPRATIGLLDAARARAFLNGRGYVIPQDIKELAPRVLRHRLIPSFEAEAEGLTSDALLERVVGAVRVP